MIGRVWMSLFRNRSNVEENLPRGLTTHTLHPNSVMCLFRYSISTLVNVLQQREDPTEAPARPLAGTDTITSIRGRTLLGSVEPLQPKAMRCNAGRSAPSMRWGKWAAGYRRTP